MGDVAVRCALCLAAFRQLYCDSREIHVCHVGYSTSVMGVDLLTREHRSWNMSRIRSRNTSPELTVRRILHRMGYRFRLHYKHLPGHPDIVLPKFKVVIFVHGCFWHRHKNCSNCTTPTANRRFWLEKFQGNVVRDKKNQRALKKSGWRMLVIWECQAEAEEKVRRMLGRFMDSTPKVLQPRSSDQKY